MPKITSTAISHVSFTQTLGTFGDVLVEFVNGNAFRYHGVPWAMYQRLLASGSKGTFHNRHLRGKFKGVKVR